VSHSPPSPRTPDLSIDDSGIAVVRFNDPERSVNVFTEAVMLRLGEIMGELQGEAERGNVRGVLIVSGKETSFIAGADIDAVAAIESPRAGQEGARAGQETFLQVDHLPVPTLAAIHGSCMGGGLELALACRFRVASGHPSTRLALPEVQLGILPAWGGTTRLPRLIGLKSALDLLMTGRTIDASRALQLGVIDAVLPHGSFERFARGTLEAIVAGHPPARRRKRALSTRLLEGNPLGRRILFAGASKSLERRTGGHYPAPRKILDVVAQSHGRSLEHGLALEAAAGGELLASETCARLIHVFRLREAARKGRGVTGLSEAPKARRLGIVGAGIMGGGIAQLAAYHGLDVRIRDLDEDAIASAMRHAQGLFRKAVKRGKLSRLEAERAMKRISGGVENAGFGTVQLAVEAVAEKLEVKKTVLRELEERVTKECVLATNTSSLSVDAMAGAMGYPERFLGLHFFNPVHRMPLVEVIRGTATDDRSVAIAFSLALRLGKVPVVVRNGPGFLVNRVLGPYLNEAGFLLAEGASIEEIDAAATRFGMPMGPLRLIDEIGIDVMRHAGESLHEALGVRLAPAPPLQALEASGRLGKKGGVGLYRYREGSEKGVDPEVYGAMGLDRPTSGKGPEHEEIRDRLVLMMINEAARILEDGIVDSAGDLDLAMIMGTGFPPFRGGLLHLADRRHPRAVLERMERYRDRGEDRFSPAPLLRELARDDRGFYDAYPARG